MNSANQQYAAAASGLVVFFALYGTSSSLIFAITVTLVVLISGLLSFYVTSFVLRTNGISNLPQLFYPESKKLSSQIWSGKYLQASTDPVLLTSLTKSYSRLPLILGEQRKSLLVIPAKVDSAVEELLDNFLRQFVCSWYIGRVSDKPDFIEELRHSGACLARSIYERLLEADFAALVSQRIAPIFLKHLYIAKKCANNQNMRTSSATNLATSDYSRMIMTCYYAGRRVHPAVSSTANEAIYLRALADVLLPIFFPPELLVVQSGRVFFREALASRLLSLVNYLASPMTMNKLLYLWASPGRKYPPHVSSWRLLLADYGWRRTRSTPLLCFSLQEMRPDMANSQGPQVPSQFTSRLLYAFQQFLRRRKSTYLDIYLLYQEICDEVIPLFGDARLLATDDTKPKKSKTTVRRALFNKIHELYRGYVDPTTIRSPSCAEVANEPVMGSDSCDSDGVELANAWRQIVLAGEDSLVDPDTVLVFQRIKQHLENRLQPLVDEFNQSDLAAIVFKSISAGQQNGQAMTRKQLVDSLAKGVYKFSSLSNGRLFSGSNHSLNSLQLPETVSEEPLQSNSLRVTATQSVPSPRQVSPAGITDRKSVSPTFSAESGDSFGNSNNNSSSNNQQQSSSLLSTDIPDLSTWRVSVPFVEFINKNSSSGSQQSIPIYVVSVRRVDFISDEDNVDDPETEDCNRFYMPGVESRNEALFRLSASSDENRRRSWSVRRYLDQFYMLEQKLKERYGDHIDSSLPPRSRVFVLLREDRAFYEKRRRIFERFLQSLFEKSELRHSRLLYNFLTTDEGFNQRSPGEGSIGRKILRTVLVKSENKPLDPFLNGFQQVAEATSLPSGSFRNKQTKRVKMESDSESIRSGNIGSFSTENAGQLDDASGNIFPMNPTQLFGDNTSSLLEGSPTILNPSADLYSAASYPHTLFDLISALGVELTSPKIASYQPFTYLLEPAVSVVSFLFRNSIEPVIRSRLNTMLTLTLSEEKVASWIRILNESLNEKKSDPPTWNDYFALRDQAISTMVNEIGLPEEAVNLIVDTLQEPVANKQLLYTLLDAFLEEIFPSVRSE